MFTARISRRRRPARRAPAFSPPQGYDALAGSTLSSLSSLASMASFRYITDDVRPAFEAAARAANATGFGAQKQHARGKGGEGVVLHGGRQRH